MFAYFIFRTATQKIKFDTKLSVIFGKRNETRKSQFEGGGQMGKQVEFKHPHLDKYSTVV